MQDQPYKTETSSKNSSHFETSHASRSITTEFCERGREEKTSFVGKKGEPADQPNEKVGVPRRDGVDKQELLLVHEVIQKDEAPLRDKRGGVPT